MDYVLIAVLSIVLNSPAGGKATMIDTVAIPCPDMNTCMIMEGNIRSHHFGEMDVVQAYIVDAKTKQ